MDYYAELEVAPDASADEIKKQYKKLALQYHPDRHPGKEAEVVPRFQAIGQAHEILLDPEQRRKYDLTRTRGTGQPFFPRQANTSRRTNPTFTTNTSFEPPPKRGDPRYTFHRTDSGRPTAPPPQPNGAPGGASAGASRYSGFTAPPPPPRAANTSSKADAKQRANVFNTWQNMRYANKNQQPYGQPQPPPRAGPDVPPRRPEPPPRGRPDDMPETGPFGRDPRQRPPSTSGDRLDPNARGKAGYRVPPAWATYGSGPTSPNEMRTPGGPNAGATSGAHMPQPAHAGNAGYMPNRPHMKNAPPPQPPPRDGQDPRAFRGHQQQSSGSGDDATYIERDRQPYTQHLHERTVFDSDALRRSASTRDATKFGQQEAARKQQEEYNRRRAASAGRSTSRSRPSSGYEPDTAEDSDLESATSGLASMGMNGHAKGRPKSAEHMKPTSPLAQEQTQSQAQQQPQQPPQQQPQQQQEQREESPQPDAMDVDPPPATGLENMKDMTSDLPQASQQANGTDASGFTNMSDMASNLPKSANGQPQNHTFAHRPQQQLDLPQPPKAPQCPSHLTPASWSLYLSQVTTYMEKWSEFNAQMVSHFQDSALRCQERLKGPAGGMVDGWLGAVGGDGQLGGWEQYCEGLRNDERVRLHWNVAMERHAEFSERHGRCRARVLKGELGPG